MPLPSLSPLLALLLLPLASPAAQSKVHIVDPEGGLGVFTDIPAAVASAGPGDTLLLKSGTYSAFTVGIPLTIVADVGAVVDVAGHVSVSSITAGSTVVLRGFDVDGILAILTGGTLWLEEMNSTPPSGAQFDGLFSSGSNVVVISSTIRGSDGYHTGIADLPPGTGIDASFSSIHVYDSIVRGGTGHAAFASVGGWSGGPGGIGADLASTEFVLVDSQIIGGSGGPGDAWTLPCEGGGDGGPGLVIDEVSNAQQLGATIVGGPGATIELPFAPCSPPDGEDGSAIVGSGPLSLGSMTPLVLTTNSPVREGTSVTNHLFGPPDALVFLGFSLSPASTLAPVFSGSLLVDTPDIVVALGVLSSAGHVQTTLPIGDLLVGMEAIDLFGQAGYVTVAGAIVIGEASALTVLDSAF